MLDYDEAYLSRLAKGDYKKPNRDRLIRIGETLAGRFTSDPIERERYVNEGLAAVRYAPLPGTVPVTDAATKREVERLIDRVEQLRDTFTVAESLENARRYGRRAFDLGRTKGTVPGGEPEDRDPMEAEDGELFLPLIGGHYYLQVVGDSMSPFYPDGTWLIIRATPNPPIGKVVIALVGTDNVCKRLTAATYEDNDTVYTLEPTNHKYRSIRQGDIRFQGYVLKVVKDAE